MLRQIIFLGLGIALAAAAPPVADDYPATALRNHEQGIVLADLTIGTDGRVSACKIIVSPNSPSLETATCSIIAHRAVFPPAHDKSGNPIEFVKRVAVRWVIPGCPAPKQSDPELRSVRSAVTITSLDRC